MEDGIYPPSVSGVPSEFIQPSGDYQRQVYAVFISLMVFIVFYGSILVASLGYLIFCVVLIVQYFQRQGYAHEEKDPVSLILMAICFFVFLFLVKGLFKKQGVDNGMRLQVTEEAQPDLFQFIRRICEETKTSLPYRVYITPEANAYVFYESSFLSLFKSTQKNLSIGLGLVNGLNLTEFKATLAHEFGHFSQSSMRLGSYVYLANRIIADIVFGRDALDALLKAWCKTNIRIAFFGWIVYGVIWVLRKILEGAFYVINFFGRSLSRQMEFHADLVAVSLTGSEAIVNALKKIDLANQCLQQTYKDLKTASDHDIYTNDIFYHQSLEGDFLRKLHKNPQMGLTQSYQSSSNKNDLIFEEEPTLNNDSWASHPSNFDREINAKKRFILGVVDERSPWLLFREANALRNELTELVYFKDPELPQATNLSSPAEVQIFIDAEHEEVSQYIKYSGLYEGRMLEMTLESLNKLANGAEIQSIAKNRIEAHLAELKDARFKSWLKEHLQRTSDLETLESIKSGEIKLKRGEFVFHQKIFKRGQTEELITGIKQELEQDSERFESLDKEGLLVHLRMAQMLDEGHQELYGRYYFHLKLQEILSETQVEGERLSQIIGFVLKKEGELKKSQFIEVKAELNASNQRIYNRITESNNLLLPELKNMKQGVILGEYLLGENLVAPLEAKNGSIESAWLGTLLKQNTLIEEKARSLFFKSMGAILSHQERIVQAWEVSHGAPSYDPYA